MKSILIVDDDEKVLKFLSIGLKASVYKVTMTVSGEEVLKLVEFKKTEAMLLDILMTPVNGLDVLKRFCSFSPLPLIAFSAHSSSCEEALRLGGNGHITKPFRPKELIDKINSLTREE